MILDSSFVILGHPVYHDHYGRISSQDIKTLEAVARRKKIFRVYVSVYFKTKIPSDIKILIAKIRI